MNEVAGFLAEHGISGFNSILLAFLYVLIRRRVDEIEHKVTAVYDWHLIQRGKEQERDKNGE